MTIENNRPIAFVLIIVGFLIGSRNDEKLGYQLDTRLGIGVCLKTNQVGC